VRCRCCEEIWPCRDRALAERALVIASTVRSPDDDSPVAPEDPTAIER
jgi:hypothetical protein